MKTKLHLSTDKKTAKEGEFIDIRWDCQACPDSLILTFDSGHKTDKIAVPTEDLQGLLYLTAKGNSVSG